MHAAARAVRMIGGLTFVLLLLAGCGGGDSGSRPQPTPTANASPSVTPPTPTPTASPVSPFTIASGLVSGTGPAVGWSDGRYLVTFSKIDRRPAQDLFGVRLASDGTSLDDDPVLLSDGSSQLALDPTSAAYGYAAIAADAAGFGVFFFGSSDAGAAGLPGEVIAFTSLREQGAPLPPVTLLAIQLDPRLPQTVLRPPSAATSDGARFVAVHQRTEPVLGLSAFDQIVGELVAVDGGSVEPQGMALLGGANVAPAALAYAGAGGVASNGSETLAAWIEITEQHQKDSTAIEAARIAPGEITRLALAETTTGSGSTRVASDGDGFLAVWDATTEIHAIRYVPHGGAAGGDLVAPPGGFVVADGSEAKTLSGVAFAGGVYLVTWLEDGVLRGARVGDGAIAATPFTIASGPVTAAAVTSDGERFLVVVERPRGATSDLLGLFVQPASPPASRGSIWIP